MPKYKIIDLFAGAGGLSSGFEQTNKFEVIGAVEINKEAVETYVYNHKGNFNLIIKPQESNISDITKINFKKYINDKSLNSDEVIIIGGPPCQGFSNANRQKNYLISGNNQLVKQFARAVDEVRPKAFLMENVKTINSNTHKFFVTDKTGDKYSSESHLSEIFGSNYNEFVKEEFLILLESDDRLLKSLVNEIMSLQFNTPILSKPGHISRIRSIVRKLKSTKTIDIKIKKEIAEIKEIIELLEKFITPKTDERSSMNKIITNAINALSDVLNKKVTDKVLSLNLLKPFLELNQLLRYLEELKNENILFTMSPKIYNLEENKFVIKVGVKTYNVVQYLESFFKGIGYEIDKGVLNSSDFFVPQKRERYMILGVRKNQIINDVSLPSSYLGDRSAFTVKDAIEDLENLSPNKNVSDLPIEYITQVKTMMYTYYRSSENNLNIVHNHVNTDSEELSLERFEFINKNGGKNFHSLSEDLKDITYTDSRRTQNTVYLRLDYNTPSPTVINVRKSMWQHPNKIRAISIREAARLQSFKDDYIFKGTKDKQYQQVGNAVPPLMARAVAESMLTAFNEAPEKYLIDEFK